MLLLYMYVIIAPTDYDGQAGSQGTKDELKKLLEVKTCFFVLLK